MNNNMKRGYWMVKFLLMGLVALGLIGLITQALWNWLVPDLFGGPVVTFWQTLGLLLLSKIIFWTFGRGGGHWRHRTGPWAGYWSQKWQQMSPEERERLRTKMKEKWCSPREQQAPAQGGTANG